MEACATARSACAGVPEADRWRDVAWAAADVIDWLQDADRGFVRDIATKLQAKMYALQRHLTPMCSAPV
jgi:hypothetical protein